jgi:hypothetical protein
LAPIVTHVMPSTPILPLAFDKKKSEMPRWRPSLLSWEAKSERFDGNRISQFSSLPASGKR